MKLASSQLGAMSFQDYIDEDLEDPTDTDYMPSNNKRKRSTPSI